MKTPSPVIPTPPPIIADSAFLDQYAATFRFRLGLPRSITMSPDGRHALFLRSGPRSFEQDLYIHDTATGKVRVLLTTTQILKGAAERLSKEELARRERMRALSKGIVAYKLSRDGKLLLVPLSGRLFVIEVSTGSVKEMKSDNKGFPIDPRLSPDGRLVSCVRGKDLYLFDIASGKQRRLTRRSSNVANGLAEFVAQEEMRRYRGYWWSPDSKRLVYQQTDTRGVEVMNIMDPAKPEAPPSSWPYPRAGKKNAAVRLGLVSVKGGKTRWVRWDREAFPYLVKVVWAKKAPLTIVVQNRRQTVTLVLAVDPRDGSTTRLLTERDDAWNNIDPQMPRWLPDGSGFLWTTEREGRPRLELRRRDGALDHPVSPLGLGYRKLLDVDQKRAEVFVQAAAEPTEAHIVRLPLSGKGPPVQVSKARGWHDAVFSRDHRMYVQLETTADGKRDIVVRDRDGAARGRLESVAERPPFTPRLQWVKVGKRGFAAIVVRPRNFEPGRRYPVIVFVYGGPNHQSVRATPYRYLRHQWFADHGFIVVSLDGRGTPARGREWERAIKGNFIDVPLADQAEGLKALQARFPELDASRTGIFGWSFGGYFAAMAVLRRPELFHAGVAVAPVTDWRDYDTHYTERYLDLPANNPDGYRKSSVMTYAPALKRPLLLIHGTADDNVYFTHSVKLSDALFRAGKAHEFLPLTNFTHLVPDPLVTRRLYTTIIRFFQRRLSEPHGGREDR